MKSESNESLYGCVKLVRCRRRVSARRRQTHEIIWIQDYDPIIMIVFPWSASRSITFPIFLISLLPSPEVDSSSIRILSFWDSLPRTFASLTRCDSPQERFIDNYPSFKYLIPISTMHCNIAVVSRVKKNIYVLIIIDATGILIIDFVCLPLPDPMPISKSLNRIQWGIFCIQILQKFFQFISLPVIIRCQCKKKKKIIEMKSELFDHREPPEIWFYYRYNCR